MATRPPILEPDPRATAYLHALRLPPTPRHVAALQRLGIEPPATQREASDLLTTYIRAGRGLEVAS